MASGKTARKLSRRILIWSILIIIFALISAYLLILANGYKIDWKNLAVEETGIIYLNPKPTEAKIYLNGEPQSDKRPLVIKNLLPGYYNVKIEADNHQEWGKTLKVESGLVAQEEAIRLWLKNPKIISFSDSEEETKQWRERLEIKNPNQPIIVNNELWNNDILITRFSRNIKTALWFPDHSYLLIQLDQEVHAISEDGSIDNYLFNLGSQETGKFWINNEGDEVIVNDGGEIKKIKVL